MTTVEPIPALRRDPARTRTLWAGRSVIAIGLLHTAYFIPVTRPSWAEWFSGGLSRHTDDSSHAQPLADFWALPGSFVVPLIALGLMITKSAREDREVPRAVGISLGVWSAANFAVLFPSGFVLGLIPAGLLISARRARH
ncbi:DUF6463 family protein [Nocardia seriolae]|uniref:DUF6463 family protein n=1 Tax=Nocardia seriolae TaxID=37332 RepID=UPI002953EE59|nr:DUF6463 family protein [Nocardia seriolae]BEK91323.1 DUF6463 family protein [Nocardia seriolae]